MKVVKWTRLWIWFNLRRGKFIPSTGKGGCLARREVRIWIWRRIGSRNCRERVEIGRLKSIKCNWSGRLTSGSFSCCWDACKEWIK
jgi:hypothetical protein